MPTLFVLPKQVAVSGSGTPLPGALLYFFATTTSTPQNTYQDAALAVAHAHPVVADQNGVFAPIFLDPSLPNYRVRLESSAGVVQPGYPVDDVPSAGDEVTSFRVTSTAPEIILDETDASSGNRKWRVRVNGEQLAVAVGNDAESSWVNVLTVDRSANTVDDIVIGTGDTEVDIAGVLTVNFGGSAFLNDVMLATRDSDSFTGTLTGLTTSPTVSVGYSVTGGLVTLSWTAQQATSNATTLTITGMPAPIRPAAQQSGIYVSVQDNGTVVQGRVVIETSGVLTFSTGVNGGAFTGSGTKGVTASTVTYRL